MENSSWKIFPTFQRRIERTIIQSSVVIRRLFKRVNDYDLDTIENVSTCY